MAAEGLFSVKYEDIMEEETGFWKEVEDRVADDSDASGGSGGEIEVADNLGLASEFKINI